jgi:hypothetical protein
MDHEYVRVKYGEKEAGLRLDDLRSVMLGKLGSSFVFYGE